MSKRRLGKTGFKVSEIGLGCWQLGGDFGPVSARTSTEILDTATKLGVNFWDTADVYGAGESERRIGAQTQKPDDLVVATKLGRGEGLYPDGYTLENMRQSLEGSAKRLRVQKIDLAQLHCVPKPVLEDGKVFDHMNRLQDEGLIRHWGASVETIEEAMICLKQDRLATLQIIFNIFRQDAADELLPLAQQNDVGIIVRLPLASGLLSGKFAANHEFVATDHRNFNRDGEAFNVGETFAGLPFEKAVKLVDELRNLIPSSLPMSQTALRWILDHPAVSSIIAGVSKPEQLQSNVGAARRPALSPAQMKALSAFYTDKVRDHVRGEI